MGCPCPYETEYCSDSLGCAELNEDEFLECDQPLQDRYYQCLVDCPPFELECREQCYESYQFLLAKCPCMDDW